MTMDFLPLLRFFHSLPSLTLAVLSVFPAVPLLGCHVGGTSCCKAFLLCPGAPTLPLLLFSHLFPQSFSAKLHFTHMLRPAWAPRDAMFCQSFPPERRPRGKGGLPSKPPLLALRAHHECLYTSSVLQESLPLLCLLSSLPSL